MKKSVVLASVSSFFVSAQSFAYDWSTVTGAIDFSGEIAGIASVAGIIAGVLVVRKGARYLLGMIK